MNIVFLGGKQAGVIGLLTLLARGDKVSAVIAYDDYVRHLAAEQFDIPLFGSIEDVDWSKSYDLIVSVHGREIVPNWMLEGTRLGGINVHPCLYACKGANPVAKFLKSSAYPKASVGVHWMTDRVDEGEVIHEVFVDVVGCKTEVEVYNALYPYYCGALLDALTIIEG